MSGQWWSWVLTLMGVSTFYLAGRKIWWAWYVGLCTQAVWVAYGFATGQWGFLVGSIFYTAVYVKNAAGWTREHHNPAAPEALNAEQVALVLHYTEGWLWGANHENASEYLRKHVTEIADQYVEDE